MEKLKWIVVTCKPTKFIIEAQKHLINKYVGEADLHYIDIDDEPICKWTNSVLSRLNQFTDEYIVFGLDDELPIDFINEKQFDLALQLCKENNYNRFELGWGASKKECWIKGNKTKEFINKQNHLLYNIDTPYQCSTQMSIWKLSALKQVLAREISDAWIFETQTILEKVACFESDEHVLRTTEEGALSRKSPNKINLLGIKLIDIEDLIEKGFIDKEKIIFGRNNGTTYYSDIFRIIEVAGNKYRQYYE